MGSTIHPPTCRRPDKHRYSTKQAARKARRQIADGGGHQMSVYHCECGGYHLGNSTADERAKLRTLHG